MNLNKESIFFFFCKKKLSTAIINLHFQNIKDVTMDKIFFFVCRKETVYLLRLQKQEF